MKVLHRNKTLISALFCFLAIASLSLTAPVAVFAADDETVGDKPDRWFLVLGAGRTTKIDQDKSNFPLDHLDTGILKFEVGVTIFKYFSVELGIINFSRLESVFEGNVIVGGTPFTGPFKSLEELEGATATVTWHVPIYKKGSKIVTLFVKGGAFRWRNKLRVKVDPVNRIEGFLKTADTDVTASVGIQVRGEGKSAFRFEIQRFETDDKEIHAGFLNFVYYY